jgi:hypothetical protein
VTLLTTVTSGVATQGGHRVAFFGQAVAFGGQTVLRTGHIVGHAPPVQAVGFAGHSVGRSGQAV